jgi:hypothetical protein
VEIWCGKAVEVAQLYEKARCSRLLSTEEQMSAKNQIGVRSQKKLASWRI